MANLSILVLTLNEQINLPDCLASCAWCDDIVVFDSFSTDHTAVIAQAHGARVVQRKFDSYAAQRNAALREVRYKHPWVLMLDADERIPQDLADELRSVADNATLDIVMYRMRRKDFFFGRWLKRSSGYPTWFGRMVRPERVRVEREVNEEYIADGRIGYLHSHLAHYPFNKGIAWWYERHNRYSTMEAQATVTERIASLTWTQLFAADHIARRRSLKRLAYRLPMRPAITFIYLYFVRLGFMDGLPGLYFSAMRASYELMIDLKIREVSYQQRHLASSSAQVDT